MKTERDFLDAKHEFGKKYADFVFSLQNEHSGQAEKVINELNKSKIWLEHFFVSAWLASAQREGYKLVPVETLEECLSWACCASSESWNDEQRDEIDKHYKVIEKAMMGASE